MFKKQITIFALLVFFLSQFGKVINYSFCKIAVYQQTSSFVCDCEKIFSIAIKTDNTSKEQAPQHITAHQSTEELFHPTGIPFITAVHTVPVTEWPLYSNNKHSIQFSSSVFHPPLQFI